MLTRPNKQRFCGHFFMAELGDENMANKSGIGGFKKGEKSKGGRPKGSKNLFNSDSRKKILEALNIVEGDKTVSKGKSFWIHIAERVYKNDMVAIALLKKFLPDLAASQYSLDKGIVKQVKFELIEADHPKKDLVDTSTNQSLEELEK